MSERGLDLDLGGNPTAWARLPPVDFLRGNAQELCGNALVVWGGRPPDAVTICSPDRALPAGL